MSATGQIWAESTQGGYLTNNTLSKSLRKQNVSDFIFKQFVDIKEDPGKQKGDTVYFDKVLKVDTAGTTLNETSTMPEVGWKIVKGSVVVTEIGNAVPYTEKLQVLSEFDPENISTQALKDDQLFVLDSLAYNQFATAKYVAVATATNATTFTSNGTATAGEGCNISDKNVRDIVDFMEKHQIPKFQDGNYRAILSTNSKRGVYDYLMAVAMYTKPEYMHNNEVGQYYNVRMVQDVQFLSDAKGTGSAFGEAIFFGKEAVVEAIAMLPEVRMKVPTDYGRSKGVAWLGIEGFAKMWDLTNDDLNSTGKGIERIVRVTSA